MRRILIIDDHEVVRAGLKRIIDDQTEPSLFGEAGTSQEAVKLARQQVWDLAILDLSLDGQSGLELLTELKQIRPRLPVLILTMHFEEQYARRAFKAGAAGFVTKDSPQAELVKAINKVLAGGRYVSSALAEKLVVHFQRDSDQFARESLSNREFEVMRLIASGKTVSEIAAMLSLSDKTISTYRARLMEKMGMKTNAVLTRYSVLHHLVD